MVVHDENQNQNGTRIVNDGNGNGMKEATGNGMKEANGNEMKEANGNGMKEATGNKERTKIRVTFTERRIGNNIEVQYQINNGRSIPLQPL